jgi:hypothetical protein
MGWRPAKSGVVYVAEAVRPVAELNVSLIPNSVAGLAWHVMMTSDQNRSVSLRPQNRRAALRPILILDKPTSAIDVETEAAIW